MLSPGAATAIVSSAVVSMCECGTLLKAAVLQEELCLPLQSPPQDALLLVSLLTRTVVAPE